MPQRETYASDAAELCDLLSQALQAIEASDTTDERTRIEAELCVQVALASAIRWRMETG